MSCHEATGKFKAVEMHTPIMEQFHDNSVSCLNCHSRAHPTRIQRTPGSSDYQNLISNQQTIDLDDLGVMKRYLKSFERKTILAETNKK